MQRTISSHIKDRYRLVGILPGEVEYRGFRVDFRTITAAEADKLYALGYKRLVPVSEDVKKEIHDSLQIESQQNQEVHKPAKKVHNVDALLASASQADDSKATKTKKSKP
ncbi:hypothetical protein [Marinoscillum furvescens]|uniref:Uncharacterized protein n=1 Tax=Marinoscillum furvescens DSM 4134 TaxID=1122208 RepID=A0A3D9L528_MARFU|nr:hypothetical protein [Marinoscillum furvescens]REE01135.1 hypothetical protein C7460_104155 [Marinoscillum furvescens DSM 4134]